MNPLDPNSSFNGPLTPARYRQGRTQTSSSSQEAPKIKNSSGKYVPIVVGALALLILPVTLWQLNNQQTVKQQASQGDILQEKPIAKVGDEVITSRDVDEEYAKQQNSTSYLVTPTNLKSQILSDLIEIKIVKNEAKTRSLSVSEDEIDTKIRELKSKSPSLNPGRAYASDLALTEKLAAVISPSALSNLVISKDTSSASQDFMESILKGAKTNGLLAQAANLGGQADLTLLKDAVISEKSLLLTKNTIDSALSLSDDEISSILEDGNRLVLVEIVKKNTSDYISFDEFISKKRAEMVQILNGN